MEFLALVIVVMVSFVAGLLSVNFFFLRNPGVPPKEKKKTNNSPKSRTEERKEKIIQLIEETQEKQTDLEECSGMITPKGIMRIDVEDLLNVSDATARRYLKKLEEEDVVAKSIGVDDEVRYVLKID